MEANRVSVKRATRSMIQIRMGPLLDPTSTGSWSVLGCKIVVSLSLLNPSIFQTRPNPPSDSPYRTVQASSGLAPKRKTIPLSRPSKRPKINRPRDVLVDTTDPARSYCLAQLEAVLRPIFTEHSLQAPLEIASQYAKQVENHLFGQFAEPDRSGAMAVGHKYKCVNWYAELLLSKQSKQDPVSHAFL
jgi:hypothetical protein